MADHIGTDYRADHARYHQAPEKPSTHVASQQMADARRTASEGFRVMHAGAGQRRWQAMPSAPSTSWANMPTAAKVRNSGIGAMTIAMQGVGRVLAAHLVRGNKAL